MVYDIRSNYGALKIILDEINPLLLEQKDFKYKILVCGKELPDFLMILKKRRSAGKILFMQDS